MGSTVIFSCLDLDSCYEKGEASRESQASEIPAPMSQVMASPKNRKFKEHWSPKSPASATMALDQEPIGTNESPSTPFSVSQSTTLPMVLFSDDDTIAACKPIQRVVPVPNHEGQFEGEEERSKWLDLQYCQFSKKVGVSIEGFESQCYSLLRCIDEERMKKLKESGATASVNLWEEIH